MSGQQIASIVAYRIDQDQFEELVSVKDAIQRMSEAVVRLAPPKIRLRIVDMKSGFTVEGERLKMNLKNNQQVSAELVFTNAQGGPAKIQAGSVTWEAITETGAFTAEVDPNDEKKALVKGNPQAAGEDTDVGFVRVSFDGDAGEGVKQQTGEGAINVIAGDADTFEIKFGTAEDQSATPPTP